MSQLVLAGFIITALGGLYAIPWALMQKDLVACLCMLALSLIGAFLIFLDFFRRKMR